MDNLTREPRMLTTEELLRQASLIVEELPMPWQKEIIRRLEESFGKTKTDE